MTNVFFERDIYAYLIKWVEQFSDRALYLNGPRQVGKTSILKKLGAEHFERCVYINLYIDDVRNDFEQSIRTHREKFGTSKFDEECGPMWEEILKAQDSNYTNDPATLVILDEIQESSIAYNNIRQIRRGLKSKLAITGSYLGIVSNFKGYKFPTGDVTFAEMSSMTFIEFLKANGVWENYDPIQTFDWAKMTEHEQETCEHVRELYRVYCIIGGYPDVVSKWVNTHNMDACKLLTADLLQSFYRESSAYFEEIIGRTLWMKTLGRVAAHMVTKSGDLDITIAKEVFRDNTSEGLGIRRRDKINALKWLDECCITGTVPVFDKLEKVTSIGNKLFFYFRDMGLLTQLCEDDFDVLKSNYDGMAAENFVYLHLLEETGKLFVGDDVRSFSNPQGQIDFVMHDKNRKRYGIEVKHGKGETKSADTALREGRIDFLIKVQDTYGSIQDNQATIPIFMLDKLKYIIKK
ncbi:MAG: AAA family ATPase [Defluviitaleaceae bacterium]|nr:AAA family ATPase [Defluviitaleaceae bacterium]MCL2273465.1 AAA family ATPase [Defluviitaleaceae bacterium]